MTGISFLYSLAANLAWMEGEQDGVNGMCAILFCLKNRVKAEWGALESIVERAYEAAGNIMIPDIRDPALQQFLFLAEDILDGKTVDNLTQGALWWEPHAYGQQVAVVGQMRLYK